MGIKGFFLIKKDFFRFDYKAEGLNFAKNFEQ